MRVLIVEDDRKVNAFLQQGLKEEGFEVDAAYDGEEALAMALAREPHVILLDCMLPKKSGLEVIAELRGKGRRTPILLVTARDSPEDRHQGLQAGADDLLGKPFRFDELLGRIRALTDRPA